jgi:hypothetical protein
MGQIDESPFVSRSTSTKFSLEFERLKLSGEKTKHDNRITSDKEGVNNESLRRSTSGLTSKHETIVKLFNNMTEPIVSKAEQQEYTRYINQFPKSMDFKLFMKCVTDNAYEPNYQLPISAKEGELYEQYASFAKNTVTFIRQVSRTKAEYYKTYVSEFKL